MASELFDRFDGILLKCLFDAISWQIPEEASEITDA